MLQQEEAREFLQLHLNAKVAELLDGGSWNEIVHALLQSALRDSILKTHVDNLLEKDCIVWTPCTDVSYSSRSVYRVL